MSGEGLLTRIFGAERQSCHCLTDGQRVLEQRSSRGFCFLKPSGTGGQQLGSG